MAVRRSVFAGSWYPGNRSDCLKAIESFVDESIPCPPSQKTRIGGIVPHAGWFFSGRIACSVIKCLKGDTVPDTVVIFGRHLHPGSGHYIMEEGQWDTPLGEVEIDSVLAERLISEFTFTVETATRFEQDNTIELQLPFIKYFFPESKILPVGVPPAQSSLRIGERVAEISRELGMTLRLIGSTDLTHYGYNYGFIPKGVGQEAVDWVKNENDKKVIDFMLAMDADGVIHESLKNQNACCPGAAATAISGAKQLGAERGEMLIYSTSFDIRPDDSFVGYVGIIY